MTQVTPLASIDKAAAMTSTDAKNAIRLVPLEGAARVAVTAAALKSALAQHHPVWLDVLADTREKTAGIAAYRGATLVGWAMLASRSGESGTASVSLPYVSYGGPVLPRADPEAESALYGWLRGQAGTEGAGALCIALSPFAEARDIAAAAAGLGAEEDHEAFFRFDNFSQVQELAPHPLDQVSKRRREALSRFIRRAEREGVEAGPCDDAAAFEEWIGIYRGRYGDIGANPIPDDFHRSALERGRAAGIVEFWTARHKGRLLGGTLFLIGAEVIDYFSSAYAMDEEARMLTPNNLLLSRAFSDFAARGKRWFNWQSSPGREGVYRYKEGWGAAERPQLYLGRIDPGPAGDRLLAAAPEVILREHPGRFVLPFSRLRGASEAADAG